MFIDGIVCELDIVVETFANFLCACVFVNWRMFWDVHLRVIYELRIFAFTDICLFELDVIMR